MKGLVHCADRWHVRAQGRHQRDKQRIGCYDLCLLFFVLADEIKDCFDEGGIVDLVRVRQKEEKRRKE